MPELSDLLDFVYEYAQHWIELNEQRVVDEFTSEKLDELTDHLHAAKHCLEECSLV